MSSVWSHRIHIKIFVCYSCSVSLISASLIALFYIPAVSRNDSLLCLPVEYPPLLYVPIFALDFVKVLSILTDVVIVALSCKGPPIKNVPSSWKRNTFVPCLLQLQFVISLLEFVAVLASLIGVLHQSASNLQENCPAFESRLKFTQAVVIVQAVFFGLYLIKLCILTDPLGLVTWPSLVEQMRSKLTHRYIPSTVYERCLRKLKCIYVCLRVKKQGSSSPCEEGAELWASLMKAGDHPVLSDVAAGFILLQRYQQEKMNRGRGRALTEEFTLVSLEN